MKPRYFTSLLLTLAVVTACVSNEGPLPGPAPAMRQVSVSSPIAVSPDGKTVWVVNPDAHTVTPVDALTLLVGTPLATGSEPWGVAVAPAGVVVLNRQDGSISILADGSRTDVPVGPEPGGLALASDGRHAWVTISGSDELVLVDLLAAAVTGRHATGPQPWAIAVVPGTDGNDTVVVTHRFARARSGSSANDGREAWLTLLRDGALTEITLPPHEFGFPNGLEAIAVTDGTAYLSHLLNSPDLPNDFQSTVSGGLSAIDLSTLDELPGRRLNLNDPGFSTPTNFPRALAVTPDGRLLLVVLAGTDAVMGIDISAPEAPRLAGFWPSGRNPRGIVLSPDGGRAYVMSYLDRELSVLDLSDPGNLDSHVEIARVRVTPETLDPGLLQGRILFNSARDPRMSRNGWMSCASCHPDGRADGTTWDLGEGPRQTMPLWNLAGTAPFHAAGTRDEVQDFEFDIENLLGGIGLAPGPAQALLGSPNGSTSHDLDALAAFVLNGIRTPSVAQQDALALGRGRQVFSRQGCSSCHYGPTWTGPEQTGNPGELDPGRTGVVTSLLHDVGTYDAAAGGTGEHGFGVPTLLGLRFSAPYFHDGRAATLVEVLEHEPHSGPALSAGDQADLISFLLSIDFSVEPFARP